MMDSSWIEERRLSVVMLSVVNHLLKRDLPLVSPSPPTPF